mgnify:CR=1 FL=1
MSTGSIALSSPSAAMGTRLTLTHRQKAAIVVKFLMQEGAAIDVDRLPETMQADLTQTMGALGIIDRATLGEVIHEFADTLSNIGLGSAGGLAGALSFLDGKIAPSTAERLKKEAGLQKFLDPWDRLRSLPSQDLIEIVIAESIEVSAVLLSKLDVTVAAEILTALDGPHARSISYAISKTGSVTPQAVQRIGQSLVAQLDNQPERAFSQPAENRVGAILTITNPTLREEVLAGLEETDPDLAAKVRKAVFTIDDIPSRIAPIDIAKAIRPLAQDDLTAALAYAQSQGKTEVCEFILGNMSKRMSDALKEEIDDFGPQKPAKGDAAINLMVATIQDQLAKGEIKLVQPDDT